VKGGEDENGLIAHDVERVAGGQSLLQLGEPILDGVDDIHGVGARLPPHLQQQRGLVVQPSRGQFIFDAVFAVTDIGDLDRIAVAVGDDDVVEIRGRLHTPESAQRQCSVGLFDAASGHFQVLSPERLLDLRDGQVVGAQLVAVQIDVDLALAPADDQDLAHAVDRFDLPPQRLIRILRHLSQAAIRRDRDGHNRRGVRIKLFNRRLLDVVRQLRQRAVDLVADVLGGFVQITLQFEGHEDQRDAF
jgi:hypothetical protein